MAEYIRREDVLAVEQRWEGQFVSSATAQLIDLINRIPTADVVEVVRCRDCVHRPSRIPRASDDHEGLNLEFPDDWCPMQCEDDWNNRMPIDDFFCGYGGRKVEINGRDTDRH